MDDDVVAIAREDLRPDEPRTTEKESAVPFLNRGRVLNVKGFVIAGEDCDPVAQRRGDTNSLDCRLGLSTIRNFLPLKVSAQSFR